MAAQLATSGSKSFFLGATLPRPAGAAGARGLPMRSSTVCMAKSKGVRISIDLECTKCRTNENQRTEGVNRYTTEKNRRNTTGRLELNKHCPFCNAHTPHKEIK